MAERSVAVYGAGAVGGYLGGKLSLSAPRAPAVTLIGRPAVEAAIRRHGLIVRERDAERVTHPSFVTTVAGLPSFDLVLLCVRTYDVPAALEDVRTLLGQPGVVLALQNGLGTDELLVAAFGAGRVLAGTITARTSMDRPGVITRSGAGGGMALAAAGASPVPEWILAMFRDAGLPPALVEDERSLRWSKLLLNMLGAATSAILDVDLATVVADPATFRIEQRAFGEAVAVMDALGIKAVSLPGYPVPLARLAMRLPASLARRTLGRRIASARGGRSPGMRTDLARGRTEIAAYNGAVHAAGRGLGVATPVNGALAALIELLTTEPDRREAFRGRPDALLRYLADRGITI